MGHNNHRARRRLITLAAAAAGALALLPVAATAQGEAWPARQLKLVVPFPAGGSTDSVGRLLAAELSKELGQTVVVENKGGANGNIGSDMVARAPADGYTLLLSGVGSNAISYSVYKNMPYRNSDFAHISLLATGPNVLVANNEFPGKTFAEFIKLTRENPGKYTHASSGSGSSGHLAMEMLEQAAKIDLVHVPYKGGAAAITDMIGGRVSVMFLNQDTLLPQVRSGKLRALAVASAKRNPAYPDTPTVAESGYPGFSAESWFGLSAPANTPPAVIQKLNQATVKALSSAEIRQKLESVGFVVVADDPKSFSAFVEAEIAKWGKAAKASGAKLD
ncbi:ABC transporter substrate-binding protein [Achromobacter sp. HZ01]|uniref:Bug family tripartite tricarboxylate transporter substrate binding protein n=1 Tax=Achromobacter sp. HZ01 TaxID=1416886 RepID=UPI000DC3640E|nr:tripartite tricarboxylate transporter substrate binding protein [Achromobacter sp. HZ01]RAP64786.1 ABC transporter substrate-binding protein [Achromobacter sp. HZ01]